MGNTKTGSQEILFSWGCHSQDNFCLFSAESFKNVTAEGSTDTSTEESSTDTSTADSSTDTNTADSSTDTNTAKSSTDTSTAKSSTDTSKEESSTDTSTADSSTDTSTRTTSSINSSQSKCTTSLQSGSLRANQAKFWTHSNLTPTFFNSGDSLTTPSAKGTSAKAHEEFQWWILLLAISIPTLSLGLFFFVCLIW